jgi:hypothetical protein
MGDDTVEHGGGPREDPGGTSMDVTRRRWLFGTVALGVLAGSTRQTAAASKPRVTVHKSPT